VRAQDESITVCLEKILREKTGEGAEWGGAKADMTGLHLGPYLTDGSLIDVADAIVCP
jgi:hypothetical protein